MGYLITLTLVLSGLWLTLSGYLHNNLLLGLGGASVLVTVFLTARMRILDGETSPYLHMPRLAVYSVWLMVEIIKANIDVAKVILTPHMVLTPRMIRIKTLPRTDFGRMLFANSITLTPGTVSVDLDDDEIIVHALLKEMTDRSAFAEMARRCAIAAGEGSGGEGKQTA